MNNNGAVALSTTMTTMLYFILIYMKLRFGYFAVVTEVVGFYLYRSCNCCPCWLCRCCNIYRHGWCFYVVVVTVVKICCPVTLQWTVPGRCGPTGLIATSLVGRVGRRGRGRAIIQVRFSEVSPVQVPPGNPRPASSAVQVYSSEARRTRVVGSMPYQFGDDHLAVYKTRLLN